MSCLGRGRSRALSDARPKPARQAETKERGVNTARPVTRSPISRTGWKTVAGSQKAARNGAPLRRLLARSSGSGAMVATRASPEQPHREAQRDAAYPHSIKQQRDTREASKGPYKSAHEVRTVNSPLAAATFVRRRPRTTRNRYRSAGDADDALVGSRPPHVTSSSGARLRERPSTAVARYRYLRWCVSPTRLCGRVRCARTVELPIR
jgi:hypothetical protein